MFLWNNTQTPHPRGQMISALFFTAFPGKCYTAVNHINQTAVENIKMLYAMLCYSMLDYFMICRYNHAQLSAEASKKI